MVRTIGCPTDSHQGRREPDAARRNGFAPSGRSRIAGSDGTSLKSQCCEATGIPRTQRADPAGAKIPMMRRDCGLNEMSARSLQLSRMPVDAARQPQGILGGWQRRRLPQNPRTGFEDAMSATRDHSRETTGISEITGKLANT